MDGNVAIPVESTPSIIVEVTNKPLRLEHPETKEPRVARRGEILVGHRILVGTVAWIIFEDGFGVRARRLREAWDDMDVEASLDNQEDGIEEFLT